MKKASRQQIGTDLGQLPKTFIMPPASELPSLITLKRWRIKWLQLKSSFLDFVSLPYILWYDVARDPLTGKKPYMKKPLELDDRLQIAREMHNDFHTYLGEGDIKKLQEICCDGLLNTARTRIEQRKAMKRKFEPWSIINYSGVKYPTWLLRWPLTVFLPNATTRVVCDRIGPLPFPESYLRQCTVRINSVQQYRLANSDGYSIMSHTDYVVIQKMTTKGEEGPWKIWGLTKPSTMEEIDKTLEGKGQDAEATMLERMQEKVAKVLS